MDVVQMPPGLDPDDLPIGQQPGFSRARKVGPRSFANRFGISIALRLDQIVKNEIVRPVADQPPGNSRCNHTRAPIVAVNCPLRCGRLIEREWPSLLEHAGLVDHQLAILSETPPSMLLRFPVTEIADDVLR